MEEKFIGLMNKTLELRQSSVDLDESLQNNPRFDSLGVLMVLLMLEDEYGIIISSDDFQKFHYVRDLFDYVKQNATKNV